MDLPDGLTALPLDLPDARAVFEVMAAQELEDTGEVEIEEADIVGDWGRPSFDVAAGTVGVFDGDRLVAYAEVGNGGRGDAAVHPDHRGRGIGTQLARWMQDRARAQGQPIIGMPVPVGSPGDRLLESLGYFVRWTSWVLALPAGAEVPARPLPPDHEVREARPEELEAVYAVQEDAFLEWSVRDREPYEDWHAQVVGRPGFQPWNLRVVVDRTHPDTAGRGEVVAMAYVVLGEEAASIVRLATRADRRGQGLAQALLADSFAVATAHGATRSELSTDSRTGALSLYEKVGMQVISTWVHRAINLA